MTNDAFLEHVLERFLGHSGSAVPADSRLLLARETAHQIAETLQSRSRRVHWRQVYGAEAPLDFPPLPKISAPGAGKILPAGGIRPRDPSKDRTPKHDVVGFVLESRTGRTLSTRCVPGTPEYAVLTAELKGNRLNELTVVDADLVSYTFHLPVPDPTLAPGMLVRGRILRKESGGSPWYLCLRLWVVESAEVRPRTSTRAAPANVSGS